MSALQIEFLYLCVFLCLLLVNQFLHKGEFVLFLNHHQKPFLNVFFKYFTHLGDGLMYVPLLLVLLWVRFGYALKALITAVILSLVTNLCKHVFFTDSLRPKAYFAGTELLQFVDGVAVHSLNSFPSGHTAAAASIAMLISLIARKRWFTVVCIVYALLVGLSRIYLAQHFLADVVYGFAIGAAVSVAVYHVSGSFALRSDFSRGTERA